MKSASLEPGQREDRPDSSASGREQSFSWKAELLDHIGPIHKHIGSDFLSSVVVFLVALPLCMGIAIASGVPPAYGIVTGIVGGIVVTVLSGSPLLVSGPAAGLAVIVWELVQQHGLLALGPVILMAGLIQMAAGGLGMGLWFRAVSPSVIHGMLAGIGITIVANQLYVMMDFKPLGHGLKNLLLYPAYLEIVFEQLVALPPEKWFSPINGESAHLAFGIGFLTVAIIMFWSKLVPPQLRGIPAAIVAITVASLIALAMQLPIQYVSVPSNLFAEVDILSPSQIAGMFHGSIFTAALAIAFIASAETLLSAAAVDKMHNGPSTRYNRELFAQGVGNSLCGLLGSLPMTGVIARSSANVVAGAKTRASAFMHGIWLLVFAGFFVFLLERVPMAALAAVLVVVGIKLIDPSHIRHLRQVGKGEIYIYWITLGTIVATDLLDGVLIGIALAFGKLLYDLLHLDTSMDFDPDRKRVTLHLRGAATFIQLPKLARRLERVPADWHLHVSIQELTYIDHACFDLLESWEEQHKAKGGQVTIRDLKQKWKIQGQPGESAAPQAVEVVEPGEPNEKVSPIQTASQAP